MNTLRIAIVLGVISIALLVGGCANHQADATPGMKVAPRSAADQAAVDRWRQARTARRQAE